VNRQEIAALLVKLRESGLHKAVSQLKERTSLLEQIEQMRQDASLAAQESATCHLQDLGLFGEVRLGCIKLGREVADQLLYLGDRVMHAQRLTESARAAHAGIVRVRLAAQEVSRERDADNFLAWKRKDRR
jgi:hypothetical protein